MMARTLVAGFWLIVIVAVSVVATRSSPAENQPADQPDIERRLTESGITLPETSRPVGIYRPVVVVGNMAYLSGHIPRNEAGEIMRGRLGEDVDIDTGQEAARRCALAMLASLRRELGSLNRVRRVVKTTGMVNSSPDFTDQPAVVNGCSRLFAELWGEENGIGARSAVGMSSLPAGSIVEIEMIVELW